MYQVVVVGAGMIGSSTAKWAAGLEKEAGGKVALVGGIEPVEKKEGDLFGAWFDEGRITRLLDRKDSWRLLAEKSIARYRDIEEKSGIKFYHEVGFLSLIDDTFNDTEGLENAMEAINKSGYNCDFVNVKSAQEKFPNLKLKEGLFGYYQPDNSGYVNPREMVKAQQAIAVAEGCEIINKSVEKIEKVHDTYILKLSDGTNVKASKVVLATGAYLNISKHLQDFFSNEVDLTLTTQTVAYLHISDKEAERLQDMPSIVTTYTSGLLDGTYILPPIRYPDGKIYLKLGHHDNFEGVVETAEDVFDWYRNEQGNREAVIELAKFLKDFIKDLEVLEVSGGCCVTSKTPTKHAPFIEEVTEGLFVAAGGCGYAAKSCDEIGRIAAVLVVEGRWDSAIEQERMKVVWKD